MKSNKRILIALHRFAVGGAETQALYLSEHLKENGYEIIVGAFGSEEGTGLQRFKRAGIDTIHWGFQEKLILNPENSLFGKARKYRFLIKLIWKVRLLKIDTVIPFTYPANIIFCNWFQKMKVKKCFWNQRDSGIMFQGIKLEKMGLILASKIISNSKPGKLFLQKHTEKEIFIIHNGVKIPENSGFSEDKKNKYRVVKIANLHGYKDHLTILEAWNLVVVEFGQEKVELLFAGRKLDAYQKLKAYVVENKLEKSVIFLGEVENVPFLLASANLAVFSSIKEGLPNGILESMAAGLPIVATDILGAREALGEDYPFLVPPKDPVSFAKKITSMITDHHKLEENRMQNKKRVIELFSMEIMGGKYIQLIENE
ncbi:hypothetical protein P872_11790 [Rhodonellum psychrophilum GCM71 = DSM 17998]|uniref:Glycosyl transferase family 1 domain-containing protein n=2 Tax=Rhodonellum TaxID=336827 RepID=U5BYK9_9BACT|nr:MULTISPECIES: glycosyltransferase [Rhodonellum]ERM80982.1 hypothetical protein P872_11790 [Rhodonellum psychrophilum GCM71 = DSM 17998]SDZ55305.1 Glycosyltransferase involved in cell wall bisynthesis [Rhodonellum ikkaensis]